jgi:lysophospholipase L1-like esterase
MGSMTYRPRLFAALALALSFGCAVSAQAQETCPAGRNPPVALPVSKKTLASQKELLIVALGSSSTEGWMATAPANTYPARLQHNLSKAFPLAHIAVINRGIGGQDAPEEVARLDTDAIAMKPSLVIWQVGANGAMAHADPAIFKKLVSLGIRRMKAAGIDVVLMDNQRSPAILAAPQHVLIDQELADMAVQFDVSLFSRGNLMDAWKHAGMGYDHFISNDSVHMNDIGYRCLADALSLSIEEGLGLASVPSRVAMMDRGTK